MDMLRTAISYYACLKENIPLNNSTECIKQEQQWTSELLGAVPSIILYWYI